MTATVWRVPEEVDRRGSAGRSSAGCPLYRRLSRVVADASGGEGAARITIADSKAVYNPGGGLAGLERAVIPAWRLRAAPRAIDAGRWRELWNEAAPGAREQMEEAPWYAEYDEPLPIDLEQRAAAGAIELLRGGLAAAGVELCDVRSAVLLPRRFNHEVEQSGGKGAVLSRMTIDLVRKALAGLSDEPRTIVCDKHGGRNRYGPLLQRAFPDVLVEVRGEGRAESMYRFGPEATRTEFRFVTGGERFLPAALASMTSKYLRELAMRAFNAFWTSKVPGLRPTAGYYTDALRFGRDIEPARKRLGIDDAILWRNR